MRVRQLSIYSQNHTDNVYNHRTNAHRINEIIKAYSGERSAKPENATNGLYYRGVL